MEETYTNQDIPVETPETPEVEDRPASEERLIAAAGALVVANRSAAEALAEYQRASREVALSGRADFTLSQINEISRKYDKQIKSPGADVLRMLE